MMTRISLLILCTLLWAAPSWAAMAHVQDKRTAYTAASQTSDTFTPNGTVTTGDLVVFGGSFNARAISSITGNQGTTFTQSGSNASWGGGTVMLWYGVAAGADTSYTVNYTGALNDNVTVFFAEFSGNASNQSGATANGAVHSAVNGVHGSGSVTPPTADNVIVSIAGRGNNTWTDDGAFTHMYTDNFASWAYLIQSSATAQSYDMTSSISRDSGMRIGAFAGAAPAGAAPRGLLLGVYP